MKGATHGRQKPEKHPEAKQAEGRQEGGQDQVAFLGGSNQVRGQVPAASPHLPLRHFAGEHTTRPIERQTN
jgi:hypothetical protein